MQNSGVFCARSASAGVVARYFSPCLIFWCFWIKPKAQKKSEIDSYFLWESSVPSIRRLLRGAGLPPFDTKRWRQKCPQGEKLRETHSVSLKRAPVAGLQANRPRFLPLLAGTSFHGSGIGPGSFAAIPSFRPGKEANTRTCEQGRTSLVRLFAENPGIAPGSGFKPPHSRLQRRKHRM